MRPKPPANPDEPIGPEPGALRPFPDHDGPFVPPGEGFALPAQAPVPEGRIVPSPGDFTSPGGAVPVPVTIGEVEAAPPPADPSDLPTVEALAETLGLNERKNRFIKNFLFAKEGYAIGQRVEPEAFKRALDEARGTPLDGGTDPKGAPAARRGS